MRIPTSVLLQMFPGKRAINVLRVAAAAAIGETVTIGSDVYEVDSGAGVTAGRISVDCSAGGTKATGTLTSDATAPSDGDTVTIGNKTYTFKTALTPTEGQVLIGASAAAALDNLKLAINRTAPDTNDGVKYKCAAAHTQVTATTNTDTTQVVQAIYTGTGPNSYATTEAGSHTSWGAVTLESGASPTAGQFTTALTTTINASQTQGYGAERISANEVLVFSVKARNMVLACTETLAGSNNAFAAAAMFGGEVGALKRFQQDSRAVNASEAAIGNMHFCYAFAPTSALVQAVEADGTLKLIDGAVTISGNRVTLDLSGSTDIAETDVVTVLASE